MVSQNRKPEGANLMISGSHELWKRVLLLPEDVNCSFSSFGCSVVKNRMVDLKRMQA